MDVAALESLEFRLSAFLRTSYAGDCFACRAARDDAVWAILVEWVMLRAEDREVFLAEHGEDQFADVVLGVVGEAAAAGHDVQAATAVAERR